MLNYLFGIFGQEAKAEQPKPVPIRATRKSKPAPPPPPPKDPIQINCDVTQLCPSSLTCSEIHGWLSAYLKQLPTNNVLLWADSEGKLNVSFSNKKECEHCTLTHHIVEKETGHILFNGKKVDDLKDIYQLVAEKGFVLPDNLQIPKTEALLKHKFEVNLTQKNITPDMILALEKSITELDEERGESTECAICMESYTEKKPPFLLVPSNQQYHEDCIKDWLKSQHTKKLDITDPKTLKIIAAAGTPLCIGDVLQPAASKAYVKLESGAAALATKAQTLLRMVKIFAEKEATKPPIHVIVPELKSVATVKVDAP